MFKSLITLAVAFMSFQSHALDTRIQALEKVVSQHIRLHGLNWKVGDSADYTIASGFINGTMHMFVREAADPGFWLEQDMDAGALGKIKIEALVNKDTGKVEQLIVNGQKQDPPAADDEEIVDSHKDHIKVPKGEFDCFYVKVHSKSQDNDSQMWVNPEIVPIAGMLKTIAPTQFGDMTMELTDFKKM